MLKALVLSSVPAKDRADVLKLFRGNKAHDFEWLREEYQRNSGAAPPTIVVRNMAITGYWNTELRYTPGLLPVPQAKRFMEAAKAIIDWAKGRL